jgi:hypothetical protein
MDMGYPYSKIEIEGVGVFTVPRPVWELLRDESARSEAAEADAARWKELHGERDRDLRHEYARANAAEAFLLAVRKALAATIDERDEARAEVKRLSEQSETLLGLALEDSLQLRQEVKRLRTELEVTRGLLRDSPIPFQDDVYQPWYDAVCDYLETCPQ